MNAEFKKALIFWLVPILFLGFWYLRGSLLALLTGIFIGLAIQTAALFINYRFKLNYYLNVFLIYLVFILLITLVVYLTFKILIEELPKLFEKLEPYLKEYRLQNFYLESKWQDLFSFSSDYLFNVFRFLYNFFGGIFSLVLIFVTSLYIAFDKNFPQQIFKILPDNKRGIYEKTWRRIKRKISFWFLGQIFLMIFIGVSSYLFVGPILKIDYAPLIGLLAGILEIVPVIGPLFTLVFASLITFLDKPEFVFFVIGYFIFLQQIENHFLVPLVMKRAVSLNPILVILGVLVGSRMGGVLGIIIILPVLGVLVELFNLMTSSKEKTLF